MYGDLESGTETSVLKDTLKKIASESGLEEQAIRESLKRGTVAILKPPPTRETGGHR